MSSGSLLYFKVVFPSAWFISQVDKLFLLSLIQSETNPSTLGNWSIQEKDGKPRTTTEERQDSGFKFKFLY